MNEVLLALVSGVILGLLFTLLKLPLPAPAVFSGVIGVLGVYLGGQAFPYVSKYLMALFSTLQK